MSGRIQKTTNDAPFTLPRIGLIKVGAKIQKEGGKEYPTSLDYFVATGNYAENFTLALGAKPTKIPVIFVSDDEKSVCYERFEAWSKDGKKLGEGDGVTFTVFDDAKADYVTDVPADDPRVQKLKPEFKRILTLKFIIPQVKGIYGHWEFSTRGTKSSINQIIAVFDHVKAQAGRVSAIPFDLVVTMVQSRKPKEVKKYPVVSLIPNVGAENLEKISAYLGDMSFGKLGILTDAKIEQLSATTEKPKALAEKHTTEDVQVIEVVDVPQEKEQEKDSKKSKTTTPDANSGDGGLFDTEIK
jgi:hypothetical protein